MNVSLHGKGNVSKLKLTTKEHVYLSTEDMNSQMLLEQAHIRDKGSIQEAETIRVFPIDDTLTNGTLQQIRVLKLGDPLMRSDECCHRSKSEIIMRL